MIALSRVLSTLLVDLRADVVGFLALELSPSRIQSDLKSILEGVPIFQQRRSQLGLPRPRKVASLSVSLGLFGSAVCGLAVVGLGLRLALGFRTFRWGLDVPLYLHYRGSL